MLNRYLLIAALLILSTFIITSAYAYDQNWIVGKWEMSYDPDGGKKDWMEFSSNGNVTSITAGGKHIPGKYTIANNEVKIVFTFNQKSIQTILKYDPDKKELLFHSDKTGNTAVYTKLK